jgi:two-component system sensor histidine kinase/response regulator
MTANAMEQDRQRCIEAGMNDAVIKPIEPEQLRAVLLRWVGGASNSPVDANPRQQPTSATTEALPEISGLDTALGLSRMAGNRTLYLTILRRYAEGQASACDQIHEALANGEIATAERLAHTMKGVCGTIGATVVEGLAGAVEAALKDYLPPTEVQRRLQELEAPAMKLIAALTAQMPAPVKTA